MPLYDMIAILVVFTRGQLLSRDTANGANYNENTTKASRIVLAFSHSIISVFTARLICIARTMPWQDVCPSVCPFVHHMPVLCLNTYRPILIFFRRRVAPLYSSLFHTKRDRDIPTGIPLTGASNANECKGYEKITIFDQ